MLSRLARGAESVARRAVELVPLPQPPLVRTRHPVVMLHGFGALANIMQCGVLHAEAMHLRGRGVLAYAPHVNPYDTIDVRATAWAERLEAILAETGAEKVNLVGFSSGGLDARWMATELGWADRIASLVTLSTPHRGTALPQYVLDRPDRLRDFAVGVMDFLGRAAYETVPPRTRDALVELCPDAVLARFDPDETLPGIWCASYTACAGKGTPTPISPPLLVPNRVLYALAGVNDGIVPTSSMPWGEPLGMLDADHGRQIGLMAFPGSAFDSKAFFVDLARLLADRGF